MQKRIAMAGVMQIERPVQRLRWLPLLVIGTALAVLGGTLIWAALDLRAGIRAQIVQHDGEILDAVALLQHLNDQADEETIASLDDPGEQFQLALKVSKLRSVLGVRLFSSDGEFINAFPAYITEAALPESDLAILKDRQPVSHFSAHARLQEHDLLAETNSPTAPLLFVEVPLRNAEKDKVLGIIQFIMDGEAMAHQYTALDRSLLLRFSIAFAVGAGILITGLGLTLRRLQLANLKLADRTKGLLQANRELSLAARTSAVGAVAAHLIHGLRNPLSGLTKFVHARNSEESNGSGTDWQTALSTTQRMEELINRVVRVLQEQQTGAEYEISIAELIGMLAERARGMADASGVRLETGIHFEGILSNRDADLILLILENLVQNGIEATGPGKIVLVQVKSHANAVIFEVCDQGPGLAHGMEARLFTPCTSGKKGGGGIGLAISHHLAQFLGAKLELAGNTASGCTFRLVLPPKVSETTRPTGQPAFAANRSAPRF